MFLIVAYVVILLLPLGVLDCSICCYCPLGVINCSICHNFVVALCVFMIVVYVDIL